MLKKISSLPEYAEVFGPVFESVMKFKEKFGKQATIRMLNMIIKDRLEKKG